MCVHVLDLFGSAPRICRTPGKLPKSNAPKVPQDVFFGNMKTLHIVRTVWAPPLPNIKVATVHYLNMHTV